MKKPLAVVLLVVLSLIGYSAAVLLSFGSAWHSVISVGEIGSRLLFAVVLPAPLIFVYRVFRDYYGFTVTKFLLMLCLPPFAGTLVLSVILIVIGSFAGGWSGLGALSIAVTWHFATIGLLVCTIGWITALNSLDRIRRRTVKKAVSVIVLTLCSAAAGSGVYRVNDLVSFWAVSNDTVTVVTALITAVPIGVGLTALVRFYKREYSLSPSLCMLCIFLPSLLISGAALINVYLSGGEYYRLSNEYYASRQNLIGTAAVLLMTVVFYAVFSAVFRRRR